METVRRQDGEHSAEAQLRRLQRRVAAKMLSKVDCDELVEHFAATMRKPREQP